MDDRSGMARGLIVALILVAFAIGGCEPPPGQPGESVSMGDDAGNDASDVNDTEVVDAPGAPPANGETRLRHSLDACDDAESTSCALTVDAGDDLLLEVQLVDEDDEPVSDVNVDFELVSSSGPMDAQLVVENAFTDGGGVAHTTLMTTAGDEGAVDVVASVQEDSVVDHIEFNIAITSDDDGRYIVQFSYAGTASFDHVSARLINPADADCSQAFASYEDDGNWPMADIVLGEAAVNPDGTVNDVVSPPLSDGESYTVAATGVDENDGADVAFGCEEGPTVAGGDSTVDVELYDEIP